jgi:hypothetical protein
MTAAPIELREARALALSHLDMHPGETVGSDLEPAEVGIVGDAAHADGGDSYHLGKDQLSASASYSVKESVRDGKPDIYAAAMDIGQFSRGPGNLRHFSLWLVSHCKLKTVWTLGIREVIYSPDGSTVKRWDRLGKRSSGDVSHTWHTHVSWFRDAHGAGAVTMVREYLYEIGVLDRPAPEVEEEPQMYNFEVPLTFAFDDTGTLVDRGSVLAIPCEPAGIGGAWADKGLFISLGTDFAVNDDLTIKGAKVRVAVHDGSGWTVQTVDVLPGARTKVSVPAAKSDAAYTVSVGRVMAVASDTFVPPVGGLITIV